MPTLVLVRHAQAESRATTDHGRRLVAQGQEQALALGAWLRGAGVAPDLVLVSTAVRARETWAATGVPGRVELRPDLYDAAVADLREAVATTGAEVGTLVLVGHNPGMSRFAWELDDGPQARARTEAGLPTAGAVVVEIDAWDAVCGVVRAIRA